MVVFSPSYRAALHLLMNGMRQQVPLDIIELSNGRLVLSTPADFTLAVPPKATFFAWLEVVEESLAGERVLPNPWKRHNFSVVCAPGWDVSDENSPAGEYTMSAGLRLLARTPSQSGPQQRVLDSQLLSGFSLAPESTMPRRDGEHLYWANPLDGGFTGTQVVPLKQVQLPAPAQAGRVTSDADSPMGESRKAFGAVVRALDGDGNPLPGGLVRLAFVTEQQEVN